MVLWSFVLLLWIGLGTSYPMTKLEPVSSNTTMADQTMVEVGATHTGKVELTLPFKISTKEELITWVTYAMRIMASRINITLASANPEVMPPERMEKLKNSSVVINNFLEKMNNDERTRLSGDERNMPDKRLNSMQDDRRMPSDEKRYQQDERRRQPDEMRRPQEPGKTVKTASMGGVKYDSRMEDMRRTTPPTTNCKKLERQLYRLTSTTENPNARNDMGVNVDIHASRPMSHQEQTRPLTFTNPFTKYIQELALINPYDHPDNKVFRDPDIFPPFNVQQHQNGYIPLPVRPAYHEENLKQYYAMANGQNVSQPSMFGVRTDPLGSLQLVPSRNNYHSPPITSQTTRTELADLNSGTIGIAFQQPHTIPFSTTLRPVLSVPFEAVITITRDSESSTPSSIMRPEKVSAVMLPPKRNSSSSQRGTKTPTSSSQKKKKNKNRDSSHSASATNVQDSLAPSSQKSKKNNSGKTTVQFDGDKSQRVSKSKKKKEKPPSTMFSALKFLVRMLTLVNGNATSPAVSNVFSKISKKGPNSKLLQSTHRGKRNETTRAKQIDDDDDDDGNDDEDRDDDDEENGNGNGNGGTGGDDDDNDDDNVSNGDNERDIFDDDDDDLGGGFSDDDDDYDEERGSLGSLEDLLPLIIPILEDISDPESDTDLGEFLAAAIPLLQGLSEPDPETGEGPDIVGVLLPLLQNLSAGKDGMGSDSGAILGPLIQLIGPFIGPLSGPLSAPLSASSSGGPNGSNLGALLSALSTPLSQPTEPGGMSIIAALTADIIALLSKELSAPGSNVDIGALVSQLVAGTSSGASAGLSGGSSKGSSDGTNPHPGPAYGPPPANQAELVLQAPPKIQSPVNFRPPAPAKKPSKLVSFLRPQATEYRPQATHAETTPERPQLQYEQVAAPAGYGYGPPPAVPANKVNSFDLLGKAFKQILASSVNLLTAVVGASTASSGASSSESSGSSGDNGGGYGPPPAYGPPQHTYGPPQQGYGPPKQGYNNYKPDSYQNIH